MSALADLGRYRKTIASFVGASLAWVGVAYVPDGVVDRAEWYALAVAIAGVFGVYSVSNESTGRVVYSEADALAHIAPAGAPEPVAVVETAA